MDLDASGSFLDQLQNQLHPDSTPDSSNTLQSYHDQTVAESPVDEPVAASPPSAPVSQDLDVFSEELFPALPTAASGKHMSSSWAPRGATASSRGTSATPGARIGAASAGGLPRPRKATERFEIPPQLQANLQNEKGKPITAAYVCKQIMTRLGTSVDLSTNARTGSLTIIISGKPEAVKQTKREVISALTLQLKETVSIPISVRPHLVGKAGANIKALMARTLTKIDMPRSADEEQSSAPSDEILDEEPEQEVVIIGDYEGVDEAKKAIEALVAQRTSKRTLRMNIERSYFPFISGPNGSQVQLLQLETETRIHVPPMMSTGEGNSADILIVGERSAVLLAEERLKAIYEDIKRTTRTLQIPVKKRQHRFIIGPKGSTLQEILEKTGCHVELPSTTDPSDTVTIRGPDNMLSTALQLVIEKSNSVVIDEVDVVETIASSTDPELFLRFVYTKERAHLKAIETTHNATILRQKSQNGSSVLEVQAKIKADADAARAALHECIKEWGNELCFGVVEIPSGLHKFVIGKGGQNIVKVKAKPEWGGRLVDVVVSHEADDSDEVIIVVKRTPIGKGGLSTSDEEGRKLIEKVREELEAQATTLADLITVTASVDAKYHGRLIGSGGAALKELLESYGNSVTVKFPKADDLTSEKALNGKPLDANSILIKGPKKMANEVLEKLTKQVAEWRHVELMSSFSETLRVPKGLGRRLVGNGKDLKWAVTAIREKIASGEVHKSKINEKELAPPTLNLRAEVDPGTTEDVVTLYGPKTIVELARGVLEERAQKLADTISEELDLFAAVNKAAQQLLDKMGGDIHRKVLRRVIGKEGKGIKKLSDKHSVYIKFADRKQRQRNDNDGDDDDDSNETDSLELSAGKVVIKGSKGDVGPARDDLVQLVEHEILHSSVTTFRFPKSCLPHIVGRSGSKIQRLKDQCEVRIDFNESEDNDEEVECVIEGTMEGCADAKEKIKSIVEDVVNTESADIHIPSYLHKHIIGPGGARIRTVVDALGGPDKVKIQFPRATQDLAAAQDMVSVKGNSNIIPTVRRELVRLINEAFRDDKYQGNDVEVLSKSSANVIHETLLLPKADTQRVAGRGGEGLVDVMRRFGVTAWYRDHDADKNSVEVILVAREGNEAELKGAKDELSSRVRVSQNVPIPNKFLDALRSSTGSEHELHLSSLQDLAKRVRQDCGILPEIESSVTKGADNASLILRGDAGSVAKAVKHAEKLLHELTKYDHVDRFQLPSEYRPHVIGRQGFTIARLRSESGAEIEILRNQTKGGNDTVIIRAVSQQNVQKAREMIEKIVKDQEERATRGKERESSERTSESKSGDARIDDDEPNISEHTADSSSRNAVPGWSGRAHAKGGRSRNVKPEEQATCSPPPSGRDSATGNYWSYVGGVTKKNEEGWKEVPFKKPVKANAVTDAKESDTKAAETGSDSSNKKKKKKATAAAAKADETSVASQEPPAFAPVKETIKHTSEVAEVSRPAGDSATAEESKANIAAKRKAAPVTADVTREAKSPEKPALADVAPPAVAPIEQKKEVPPAPVPHVAQSSSVIDDADYEDSSAAPKEDEWHTVNTVKKYKQAKISASAPSAPSAVSGFGSIPTMPLTDGEVEKKKKKNKNKKKKKTGTDSASAMPGEE
ncbi:hypothetical protein PhCBS80983_g02163 [Powellomyces hirtus]|uniref:K Homology domain-containing protein n=1 Tax=Powellomyces hirtus TaxID=109895 RepID=A0A507E961_9FUNG|nr:hypothetical protein PhCBS80983_g02163 [Powellomyces hirtus]